MDSLQICEFIVIRINTNTKEEASITPIDYFIVPEL